MKNILIHDGIELGEYMFNLASQGITVTAVVFSNYAEQLMEYFIADPDIVVECVIYDSCDEREYYVTLSKELVFDVAPVWDDKGDISCQYQTDRMIFDHGVNELIKTENLHCEQEKIAYAAPCEYDCMNCYEDCSVCRYAKNNEDIADNLELFDSMLSDNNQLKL